jgi:hypothetical protein
VQYMWFDDKDYLMRKMLTEGKNGDVSESVYSYAKVTINEPSPIKEGMPEAPGYGASEAEMQKMLDSYQDPSTMDSSQYYGEETPIDEGTTAEF